jgi:hypothetical protein
MSLRGVVSLRGVMGRERLGDGLDEASNSKGRFH